VFIRTDFGSRVLMSALMLLGAIMAWVFLNVWPMISSGQGIRPVSGWIELVLFLLFCAAFIVQLGRSAKLMETGEIHSREMGVSVLMLHPQIRDWYARCMQKFNFDWLHVIAEPIAVYLLGRWFAEVFDNNIWRSYFFSASWGMFLFSAAMEGARLVQFIDYRDQFIEQSRQRDVQREATEPFRPKEIGVPEVEVVHREDYPVLHPSMADIYADTKQEPPR